MLLTSRPTSITSLKRAYCAEKEIQCAQYQVEQDPSKAIKVALEIASDMNEPLIYVGGSTYVVAEVMRSNSEELW